MFGVGLGLGEESMSWFTPAQIHGGANRLPTPDDLQGRRRLGATDSAVCDAETTVASSSAELGN